MDVRSLGVRSLKETHRILGVSPARIIVITILLLGFLNLFCYTAYADEGMDLLLIPLIFDG